MNLHASALVPLSCVFRQWRDSAASGTYHFPTQFVIKKSFKGIDQMPPICIHPLGLSQLQASCKSQHSHTPDCHSVCCILGLWLCHLKLHQDKSFFPAPVKAKKKKKVTNASHNNRFTLQMHWLICFLSEAQQFTPCDSQQKPLVYTDLCNATAAGTSGSSSLTAGLEKTC